MPTRFILITSSAFTMVDFLLYLSLLWLTYFITILSITNKVLEILLLISFTFIIVFLSLWSKYTQNIPKSWIDDSKISSCFVAYWYFPLKFECRTKSFRFGWTLGWAFWRSPISVTKWKFNWKMQLRPIRSNKPARQKPTD